MSPILRKVSLLLVLSLGFAGCSTFNTFLTDSRSPDHQIIIDGKSDDWHGELYIAEDERVSLGFLNDQENLYVCLLAEDNFTRNQIMMQGLTVWFDPQGGKKKALGIKFPLGMAPGERPMPFREDQEEPRPKNLRGRPVEEMEIIRSGKEEPQKMNIAEAKGIEIKAMPSTGMLVYELKIPLVQTDEHPIALATEAGRTLGVGFETAKFDLSKMPRRPAGMPGGGARPPMAGGPGRGMGGFGRGLQMPEGLKIWAIVKLAEGKTSQWPRP